MWNILKSNARKKLDAEKIKFESEKIKLEAERLDALYNIESKRLNDKISNACIKFRKKEKDRIKKLNEICPKCSSNKVVDKISQLKGEINGTSFGSMSFGSGYSSGSIHGSMDTYEINKCNDCGNEWKKVTYNNYGETSWDQKIRFLRLSISNFIQFPDKKEPYYVIETRNFWSGTKLEILPLLLEKEHIENEYYSVNKIIMDLIKGNEDILIDKLGFIK